MTLTPVAHATTLTRPPATAGVDRGPMLNASPGPGLNGAGYGSDRQSSLPPARSRQRTTSLSFCRVKT